MIVSPMIEPIKRKVGNDGRHGRIRVPSEWTNSDVWILPPDCVPMAWGIVATESDEGGGHRIDRGVATGSTDRVATVLWPREYVTEPPFCRKNCPVRFEVPKGEKIPMEDWHLYYKLDPSVVGGSVPILEGDRKFPVHIHRFAKNGRSEP